jgi:hypothetical protein
MPRSLPIVAASLLLLVGCAACANGSTSTYTQAPIFFNDGPGETEQAFEDGAAFVTAEGNAILPLGPSATPAAAPSPEQGSLAMADLSGAASIGPGGLAIAAGVSASPSAPGANVAASAAVSTGTTTLSLRAPVLGSTTVNSAVLAAPSAINPALVTSVTSHEQGLLCVPSLRLKC